MLVFIDESGDSGMKNRIGSSQFFFVTAVLFEDNEDATTCDVRIDKLREQMRLHPRFEFHFNSCNNEIRKQFLQAVGQHQFFYHSFGLNKHKLWSKGFQDKDSFYKYATGIVFENAKPHLKAAKVVIDKSGNREFRTRLSKYLKSKMNDEGAILIRKVAMEASHANNLIQLADMVCGAVARCYNPEKTDGEAYRQIVSHREMRVQVWPK